jgi:N-acetyl-anhydromuramyl-L-alanine amidase AmpD
MGNFESQRPSCAQIRSCVKLVAWLCQEKHIDPSQIAGHRDRAEKQTVCPGKDFYRYLEDGEFVGWVKQTLAGQEPMIDPGPPLKDGPFTAVDALPATTQKTDDR